MKYICAGLFLILTSVFDAAAENNDKSMAHEASIAETHVMLYYKSLQAPRSFYSGVLGLKVSFEDDWVSIYQVSPGAFVGLVQEGGTAYHKTQQTNAVMLSLAVNNVDTWYEKITGAKDIVMLKELYNHSSAPIRAFLVEDPGGYTVEIFQWLK